jgi:hypothetical protein
MLDQAMLRPTFIGLAGSTLAHQIAQSLVL